MIIKGGEILIDGKRVPSDVLVRDSRILAIGNDIFTPEGEEVLDASGCLVSYGFADLHVHFREPGYSYKETIRTGSLAAAAGGYTCVCTMPNLNPVPDSVDNIALEQEIIDRDAVIDVLPYASITLGRRGGELVDFAALKNRAVAFSDDGSGVQDEAMMRAAMLCAASLDCVIAAHCEDNSLLRGGYIHDGRYAAAHGHKGICSESEWGPIARDIELSAETGCRYHVCHISTRRSVELIREAKARGLKVSCETAPHYLALCEDDLREDGRFKMNPPLRSADDRQALIEGLCDGTIDAIATDHAPHSAEEKSKGLRGSAMGIVGLETAFPVVYTTLVKTGKLSLARALDALTDSPRRVFGLKGSLKKGEKADLCIIDLNARGIIRGENFQSMGKATPFEGMECCGQVRYTLKDGKIVWKNI